MKVKSYVSISEMVKWVFIGFVCISLVGCSSVATSFKTKSGATDQFEIRVFKGTSSSTSDESILEQKAKEFAATNGFASYEILPGYTTGYGQPFDSDGASLAVTLMGAVPQEYKLYLVQFKR